MTAQTAAGLPRYVQWELGGDPDGTHLLAEIECSYADLVTVFGEPNSKGDDYKTDAQWELTFVSFDKYKSVSTIYNYKTGKNYLGKKGPKTQVITDWHIGGKDNEVVVWIARMLIAHYRKRLGEI